MSQTQNFLINYYFKPNLVILFFCRKKGIPKFCYDPVRGRSYRFPKGSACLHVRSRGYIFSREPTNEMLGRPFLSTEGMKKSKIHIRATAGPVRIDTESRKPTLFYSNLIKHIFIYVNNCGKIILSMPHR